MKIIISLNTSQQKIAASTALLVAGLCVFDCRNQFDLPHTHSEAPTMPTRFSAISAPATNVAHLPIYSVDAGSNERRS